MNALFDGLRALGAARLVAMGVVAVGLLGLAADVTRLLEGPSGGRGDPGRGGGGASESFAAGEDDSLISLSNVDGQLRASALRRLTEMVERHPDESLTIVRAWMQESSN